MQYYIGNMAFDSDYLSHYGVKGMRWGKHKNKYEYVDKRVTQIAPTSMIITSHAKKIHARDEKTGEGSVTVQKTESVGKIGQFNNPKQHAQNMRDYMSEAEAKLTKEEALKWKDTKAGKKYLKQLKTQILKGQMIGQQLELKELKGRNYRTVLNDVVINGSREFEKAKNKGKAMISNILKRLGKK